MPKRVMIAKRLPTGRLSVRVASTPRPVSVPR
jgi:hypothetical protein